MCAVKKRVLWCILLATSLLKIHGNFEPETDESSDECVDEAYQYWLKVLLNQFIRYADLTAAMASSRRLFDVLLQQKMSSATFKEYCKEHRYARSYFNRCDNTAYKKMVVSNFGLADYICATRVGDYGQALSCLYGANDWATVMCRPNCTSFEDESKLYLERDLPGNITTGIMHLMAMDCSYLSCMLTCRRPILAEECGQEAASLITDALRVTFSTSLDIFEPLEMRQMIKGGFQSSYPKECRALASPPTDDQTNGASNSKSARHIDENGRPGNSRRMRMLVAVSTDILTNSSLMCRFGNRLQEFFASYCPNGYAEGGGGDGDFMSLAIAVT